MEKLLTVIVPVYKVERYINKCLDSCVILKEDGSLNEDLMNLLEVIIVNDGTPDRSAELSREYTILYPQTFRQIDKENGGHGSAWNVGLKEATGKYVRFLDSDDWLSNFGDFVEKLRGCQADIVFTHKRNVFEGHEEIFRFDDDFEKIKSINELDISKFMKEAWYAEFQKSTYRTSSLLAYCPFFMERVRYDDAILYALPILTSKTYICYDVVVYNYLIGRNEQSMSMEQQIRYSKQRVNAFVQLCDYIDTSKPDGNLFEISEFIKGGMYLDIMPIITHLKYHECKMLFKIMQGRRPEDKYLNHSKLTKRFEGLPFFVAYTAECVRRGHIYRIFRKLI